MTDEELFQSVIKVQNVSRETFCNFIAYEKLLRQWNSTVNLVGKSTLDDFWQRHLLDSLQLYGYIESPDKNIVMDLGSGAGFPGLVLAMTGVGNMHVVESDSRKCAFLAEVAARTNTPIKIHNCRIETIADKADIITARALAPLTQLIEYSNNILNPSGKMILLKGASWQQEVAAAKAGGFTGDITNHPSITDPEARVLEIKR